MSSPSLMYYNDQWGKVIPQVLRLEYKITAAATLTAIVPNSGSLITTTAIASQSVIDDFLGTTNEFLVAAFDATAMGADTFAGIVNLGGQARVATSMVATCYSGTGGGTQVTLGVQSGSLTASTLETAYALGSSGNLAFKLNFGNTPDFDALTSGTVVVNLYWIAK